MTTLRFESTVSASREAVFNFFNDPANLIRISPPSSGVRLESAETPLRTGSRVILSVPILGILRRRWVSLIAEQDPPHGFRDSQISGPFASWEHRHQFEENEDG